MGSFEQKILLFSLMLNFLMIMIVCGMSVLFFHFKDQVTRASEEIDNRFAKQEQRTQQMYSYILGYDLLSGFNDPNYASKQSPAKSTAKPTPTTNTTSQKKSIFTIVKDSEDKSPVDPK